MKKPEEKFKINEDLLIDVHEHPVFVFTTERLLPCKITFYTKILIFSLSLLRRALRLKKERNRFGKQIPSQAITLLGAVFHKTNRGQKGKKNTT